MKGHGAEGKLEALGIKHPIIQAPMAGVTTPELVAAASNAGGLGSLGAALMKPEEIRTAIKKIRNLTSKPFNINLFAPTPKPETASTDFFLKQLKSYQNEIGFHLPDQPSLSAQPFEEQAAVLLEEKIPIFSFTFGIPAKKLIQEFKDKKITIIGTATHLTEAVELEKAGVDYIVCQGKEAGGHRGTFIGTFSDGLISAIELVRNLQGKISVPLIASGGIMTGMQIVEHLKAGASAVQLGTVFIVSHESMAPEAYKKALLEWKNHSTILTRAFSGRWARSVANRYCCDMAPFENEIPPFPIAQAFTMPMRQAAAKAMNPDFMSLWAGTEFKHCKSGSAGAIIHQLIAEMEEVKLIS